MEGKGSARSLGWCLWGVLWHRRADGALASMDSKEERVVLLDSWLAMEEALGDLGTPQDVRVTPTLTRPQSLVTPDATTTYISQV